MRMFKKLILATLITLLLAVSAALAEDYACVTSSSANLRTGPGTQYNWLASYTNGSWMQVLGESGDWYYVQPVGGDKLGYMSKSLLSTGGGSVVGTTGVVNNPKATQFLNLRQYPSTAAPVVGYYYNGTLCTVLDSSVTGWYHVTVGSAEGYFMSQYIKLQGGGSTSTTTAYVSTGNSGKLNLRAAPSSNASILGQYSNGTLVNVLLKGNTFWKVSVNGATGFMMSSMLSAGPTPVPPGPTPYTSGYCYIHNRNDNYANLRKSASVSSALLKKCANGLRFEIIMAGSEWCKVYGKSSGLTGYIMTKLIDVYDATTCRTVQNGGSYVNLRKNASQSSTVLSKVPSGSIITVVIPGDTWCKVTYNGTTGYMMTQFLK